MAADVFARSYREYLALKPTHYRWYYLAPQSIANLEKAHEQNWSDEKVADYLHCPLDEARDCRGRFEVSRKVNAVNGMNGKEGGESARLRQALVEWVGLQTGMENLSSREKETKAAELARMIANHLFAAATAGEGMFDLSRALEGGDAGADATPITPRKKDAEPPAWGPQWKD